MLGSSKKKDDTGRIATLADIEAFEAIPLRDRKLPPTTYAMLRAGAALAPDAAALSFFPLPPITHGLSFGRTPILSVT